MTMPSSIKLNHVLVALSYIPSSLLWFPFYGWFLLRYPMGWIVPLQVPATAPVFVPPPRRSGATQRGLWIQWERTVVGTTLVMRTAGCIQSVLHLT